MTVYLDNAATTFRKPECVYQAMDKANRELSVNAGRGAYALAREAVNLQEETRQLIKEAVGAPDRAEVVYTPSATMALNEIIGGCIDRSDYVVYVSPYEHNAVVRTLHGYQRRYGFSIRELPLCPDTLEIDLKRTAHLFAGKAPSYVFLTCVSNVTGYILPIEELCEMTKSYGGRVILDGAQALGAIPFNVNELEADVLVFAGHKALHGPFGIGGYLMMSSLIPFPVVFGGTGSDSLNLEMPCGFAGLEPGSPDIVAVAGLKAVLEEMRDKELCRERRDRERMLTRRLLDGLRQIKGIRLYGLHDEEKRVGIVSLNVKGYLAPEVGRILDTDFDIAVRTGYHCAPLIHAYLGDMEYSGTVRVSPDWCNTEEDIDKALLALEELAREKGR